MVYISFVVTSTGSISDVSVARGVCTLLDAEAVRVVKSMPNWIPGKQRGKAVSVSYMLPIKFELTDKGEGVSAEKPLVSEDVMKIIQLKYTNSTTGKEISGQLVRITSYNVCYTKLLRFLYEPSITGDTVSVWITDSTVYNNDSLELICRYQATDSLFNLQWREDTLPFNYRRPT